MSGTPPGSDPHGSTSTLLADCLEAILGGADREKTLAALTPELRAEVESCLLARSAVLRTKRRKAPPGRIGPYALERLLGRGGQGEVWLAVDERIPRRVALKLLGSSVGSSEELLGRFRREAQVAARLDHPSIATVYEAGLSDGMAYLAMRYVEGKTLAQLIDDLRAGRPVAFDVLLGAERCARALHVAHEAGVVHRDLKPQNVIVTCDGTPVILDFGLADDVREGGLELTRVGQVLGTPAYAPPERISAGYGTPDRRSDVWSLAATFYEVLTLRRIADAPTREGIYRKILETDPPPLASLRKDLPKDLSAVFSVALEKQMDRRYATALAFAEDLRRVRAGEPILARPTPALVKARMWVGRHRAVSASAALALLAIVAAFVVAVVTLDERTRALERAHSRLRVMEASVLAERDPGAALRAWLDLAGDAPPAIVNDAVLQLLERTREQGLLLGHGGRVFDLAFGSDGRQVATACADGAVRVFAAATCELQRTFTLGSTPTALVFVRAGTALAVGDAAGGLRIVSLDDGKVLRKASLGTEAVSSLVLLPGERKLLAGTEAGLVMLLAFEEAGNPRVLHYCRGPITRIACTQQGDRAFVAARSSAFGPGTIETLALPDGACLARLVQDSGAIHDLVLVPGEELLLAASSDNHVWEWHLGTDHPARKLRGHDSAVQCVALHPDGKTLATGSSDRTILLWSLADDEPHARLTAHSRGLQRLLFSPDGERMATADEGGGVRLWLTSTPRGLARLEHSADRSRPPLVGKAHFSPDGRKVLTVPRGLAARLWDAERGACLRMLDEPEAAATDACFSPDGREVAVACADGTVYLYALEEARPPRQLRLSSTLPGVLQPTTLDVLYAPGSERLLLLSNTGRAELFDVESGRAIAELLGLASFYPTGTVRRAAFRSDGRVLATVLPSEGGNKIALWRLDSGERLATLPDHAGIVESLEFSPDGRLLVSASTDGTARVFAVGEQGAKAIAVLSGHSGCVLHATFAPDGEQVLTSGLDMTARLWDTRTGAMLATYSGHDGLIYSARFSPDGARVLTASWDHTVGIFARATAEPILRHRIHEKAVLGAEWSPDGASVVSTSCDGTARIWPSDPVGFARRRGRP